MKTIKCDKCKKEIQGDSREVSILPHFGRKGNICLTVYTQPITYDLCPNCSDEYDKYLDQCISYFFDKEEVNDEDNIDIH